MKKISRLRDVETPIGKARKKPIVIRFCWVTKKCFVETREGRVVAEPGDVIIEGIAGEVYPCGRKIFLSTYDIVSRGVL